ncbi:PilZ domain-containing protein [Sphingomonas morindae]|uniref:PilZ domain-containing protein n=1 Tax=Sphingomonas morindae TaxID=1541170 RepID=A0ABY4X5H9_9SPHN|nr:PilZ domain-containing protein [Sphingomonas morindae]USI72157.1 PilZ domain-containing protein [Sphingomonas morindae]
MSKSFELPTDKRERRRQLLLLSAEMDFLDGRRRVHLLNISQTGAKLDCDQVPVPGEPVTLRCGTLAVPGRAAWVDGNRFGVAFDKPIDSGEIAMRGQQHLAS